MYKVQILHKNEQAFIVVFSLHTRHMRMYYTTSVKLRCHQSQNENDKIDRSNRGKKANECMTSELHKIDRLCVLSKVQIEDKVSSEGNV